MGYAAFAKALMLKNVWEFATVLNGSILNPCSDSSVLSLEQYLFYRLGFQEEETMCLNKLKLSGKI